MKGTFKRGAAIGVAVVFAAGVFAILDRREEVHFARQGDPADTAALPRVQGVPTLEEALAAPSDELPEELGQATRVVVVLDLLQDLARAHDADDRGSVAALLDRLRRLPAESLAELLVTLGALGLHDRRGDVLDLLEALEPSLLAAFGTEGLARRLEPFARWALGAPHDPHLAGRTLDLLARLGAPTLYETLLQAATTYERNAGDEGAEWSARELARRLTPQALTGALTDKAGSPEQRLTLLRAVGYLESSDARDQVLTRGTARVLAQDLRAELLADVNQDGAPVVRRLRALAAFPAGLRDPELIELLARDGPRGDSLLDRRVAEILGESDEPQLVGALLQRMGLTRPESATRWALGLAATELGRRRALTEDEQQALVALLVDGAAHSRPPERDRLVELLASLDGPGADAALEQLRQSGLFE